MTRSLVLSAVALSNDFFQCARKLGRLIGVEFHDEPTATLERNPHDDPTSLFGYFHRAVTRPRFHCCHRASSSCSDLATCRVNYSVSPSPTRVGLWLGTCRRGFSQPDRRRREATLHVIVHQADRLHHRVRGRRAEEAKAQTLELSRHGY